MGFLKNVQLYHAPRAVVGKNAWWPLAITPHSFYVQVTFSKEDRLSIGCPVSKILAFEERPHGRPAAHTQDFPLIRYELARSLVTSNYLLHSAYREQCLKAMSWGWSLHLYHCDHIPVWTFMH